MKRISYRAPFLTQLGSFTQGFPGANIGTENCEDIKIDRQENIICVGTTQDKFGAQHYGGADAVVAKLNKDGELLWTFQTGTSGNEYCSGLAVDHAGNIYCAGDTTGSLGDFIHGETGGTDAFLMKLSPAGELIWIKQFGTAATDICTALTIGKSGDIYCGGQTSGNLGVLGHGARETNAGGTDAFLTRFDSSGNLLWITQFGANFPLKWKDGTTTANKSGNDSCNGVVVDPEEKFIYCSGNTKSDMGEPNGSFSVGAPYNNDVLILRLDASNGQNARSFQLGHFYKLFGEGSIRSPEMEDSCRKIAIGHDGHLWCAGQTSGSLGANFFGGTNDAILVKVNSDFSKAKVIQLGTGQIDAYKDVIVDRQGNILTTGSTHGSLVESITTPGAHEHPIVAKYSSNGTRIWLKQLGVESIGAESHGNNRCVGVAVDSDDNVYCAGKVNREVGERNGSYPGFLDDIFFWRLDSEGRF